VEAKEAHILQKQEDATSSPTEGWFCSPFGALFLLSYADRVAYNSIAAPVGESLGPPVVMLRAVVTAYYVDYVVVNLIGGLVSGAIAGPYERVKVPRTGIDLTEKD
jgi:hypothetical protein